MTEKPLYVVCTPNTRGTDVEIQTLLVRPEVKIVYSLEALAEQVQNHVQADNTHTVENRLMENAVVCNNSKQVKQCKALEMIKCYHSVGKQLFLT